MMRRRQLGVRWITPTVHQEGLTLFRRYDDQDFSVVDRTSVVVARRANVREVFAFDRHFVTMGLLVRP
jgi:predicted nucleic acid-binding protein